MPLYEYECESCAHRFERIQRYSDPPIDTCPACGGPVRKLFSSPAIQFKGSGWYITDYARKGSEKSKSDAGAGDTTTEKTGEKSEKSDKSDKSSAGSSDKTAEKSSDKASSPKDSPKTV